jgi:hypothetical protein
MKFSGKFQVTAALPPGKIVAGTFWMGGWVSHRTGLDVIEKRKILPLLGIAIPTELLRLFLK